MGNVKMGSSNETPANENVAKENAANENPANKTVEMTYAEAIRDALDIALTRDKRVVLMGEDIGVYGGAFQVTGDLVHKHGEDRVMDTPISELGGAGVAVGAAATGLRPIFEFQFSDFAMLAMEQICNQAATMRYMLGGRIGASCKALSRRIWNRCGRTT